MVKLEGLAYASSQQIHFFLKGTLVGPTSISRSKSGVFASILHLVRRIYLLDPSQMSAHMSPANTGSSNTPALTVHLAYLCHGISFKAQVCIGQYPPYCPYNACCFKDWQRCFYFDTVLHLLVGVSPLCSGPILVHSTYVTKNH